MIFTRHIFAMAMGMGPMGMGVFTCSLCLGRQVCRFGVNRTEVTPRRLRDLNNH